MVEITQNRKRWQNLIYLKCPNCNERMIEVGKAYKCQDEDCNFFLFKDKMIEILTDPTHAAVRFMSERDRSIVDSALKELGVVVEKDKEITDVDKDMNKILTEISDLAEKHGLCWERYNDTLTIRQCQCE